MLFEALQVFVLLRVFDRLDLIVSHAFSGYFNGRRAYLTHLRQDAVVFDLYY